MYVVYMVCVLCVCVYDVYVVIFVYMGMSLCMWYVVLCVCGMYVWPFLCACI